MPEAVRQRFDSTGRRVIAALLAAGALLLMISVVIAAVTFRQNGEDTARVAHTLEVETAINLLTAQNERIETGRRGFIIQPDPSFTAIIGTAIQRFNRTSAGLRRLVADNPAQIDRLNHIDRLSAERKSLIAQLKSNPAGVRREMTAGAFNTERTVLITREIRTLVDAMLESEAKLLDQRNNAKYRSFVRFYTMGGIVLALLIGTLLSAMLLVMRYNRDLTRAQAGLRAANDGLELAVADRTAELSRANQEIQRFAYIVSHDLRSPLVNVLGFTSELDTARKDIRAFMERVFASNPELKDQAAWLAVDEDLPEALGFIRKSTEKMDRLINSILELSRQGRRPLTPEQLDMDELADGVVASLHQRAEDSGATVTVESLPRIESDRVAVEQILSNLIENALKYLDPSRPGQVSVSGRRDGRVVRIAVQDNGRGIAPADHERVFDLFRRAGTQDQPGEGIGLANVRALAYRLGGRIELDSALDAGATFTLSLPERFVAQESAT